MRFNSQHSSRIRFGYAMAALLLSAFAVLAQTPPVETQKLTLNQPIERQIKGGETHSFQFKLKAGEYALTEVEQKNINVVVSLFDSKGKLFIEMDGKGGRLWREAISVIAELKGAYRVEIKAYGKSEMAGNYTVKLIEQRKSAAKDRQRIEAESHLSTGRKFYEQGRDKFQEAVKEYEAAVSLWRNLGETEQEAVTLFNIGWTYTALSKYEQAITAQTRATKLFQKTKDRLGEGKAVNGLGNTYNNQELYEKAKDYYEQALRISREIKDRSSESESLLNLGDVYGGLEQYDKSLQHIEQSLKIAQEINSYTKQTDALDLLASLYLYSLKDEKKGFEVFERILLLTRSAKDRKSESLILRKLGGYYTFKDDKKSLEYYEQVVQINREIKDKQGEMFTLSNLGFGYGNLKKWGKALENFEQSAVIAQESKNWRWLSLQLFNIGSVYFELKNYEKARFYDEKALEVKGKIVATYDAFAEYNSFFSTALIYESLKEYDKAVELYEKALRKSFEINRDQYILYESIARVYLEKKQYEKSREYFEKAFADCTEKKCGLEVHILLGFGELYQDQKLYEKAREYFEQSFNLAAKDKDSIVKIKPLLSLGKFYIELKQHEKAQSYLEQALNTLREADYKKLDSEDNFQIFSIMLELWVGLKNPQFAIFYGKKAINAFQTIRDELKSFDKDTQRSFVRDKEPIYRKLADLLISEGRLPEAQSVLDLLKVEEFNDVVPRRNGETPAVVPYSQAEVSVSSAVENLAKLERERGELLKQKEAGALSSKQQTRLDNIPSEIEAANKAFRLALDALGKSETGSANRVAEIQGEKSLQRALQTLDRETDSEVVALYTVLGNEQTGDGEKTKTKFGWVILVTPTSRKAYPIDVADLEQTVFQFRDALSNDRYDPKFVAQKLYDKIFRQSSAKQKTTLETDLQTLFGGTSKNKTLMWSLDGILRYVPMAALHDGNNYLVEKYGSVIFTKESFLTLTEKNAVKWNALGLGVSEGRENFNALPGAERELKDIVRPPQTKTGIMDGEIKLNKDFSEEATLKLLREGKFPVIHIASHYAFNATDPTSSFLLVGDGQLSFSEMQDKDNLFGAIDLLTLSACDTGVSGNGKEAEGFAYLAQSLGAKSVIASLWKVSDAGTPELMIRFYQIHQQNPQMPKGEAFRQAQISLLDSAQKTEEKSNAKRSEIVDISGKKMELPLFVKDEQNPFAHPHFWSSFVLIGNWR